MIATRPCRVCTRPVATDAVTCPSCGATVAQSVNAGAQMVLGVIAGVVLGIVLALVLLVADLFAASSRTVFWLVVDTSCLAIAAMFVGGIAAFVRRNVLFGFLLVTAGIVVTLPAFAFGSFALDCVVPRSS